MGQDTVNQVRHDGFIIERRQNLRLRAIYDDVRARIAHVFDGHADWVGSPTEYLVQRLVHETYPDLSSDEVRTLITVIERRLKTRFSRT